MDVKNNSDKPLPLSAYGLYCSLVLPGFEQTNQVVSKSYFALAANDAVRRSHYFHGRYENVYIEVEKMPSLTPIIDTALAGAREILDTESLKYGFWFNEMAPGQQTTRHNHDELDELLSCVYYIDVADNCGDLILHQADTTLHIPAEAGRMVYFDPAIDHEVAINRSDRTRLSVAFNFG